MNHPEQLRKPGVPVRSFNWTRVMEPHEGLLDSSIKPIKKQRTEANAQTKKLKESIYDRI
jgi:hypothetical protein